LNDCESNLIAAYDSIRNGYNLTIGGSGGLFTSENKLTRRLNRKDGKPVFGYSKNGDFVKKWISIKHCAQEINVNPCDVRRTIRGQQLTCRGFVLRHGEFDTLRLPGYIFRDRDSSGRYI